MHLFKVRGIWKHAFNNLKGDGTPVAGQKDAIQEWFFVCGTDTYVIVENLRQLLNSDAIKRDTTKGRGLYLGRRFLEPNVGGALFNSGGAGYALNRAALKLLMKSFPEEYCGPKLRASWEDVMISKCLKEQGIVARDTRDRMDEERFHPFGPGKMVEGLYPQWLRDYTKQFVDDKHNGLKCCSASSISFHYVSRHEMVKFHNRLHQCR